MQHGQNGPTFSVVLECTMDLANGCTRQKRLHTVTTQRDDQQWLNNVNLAFKVRQKGRLLLRFRVAIVRWTVFDDARNEHVLTRQTDTFQEFIEVLTRGAYKRLACQVLIFAWRFPYKHDFGVWAPSTWNYVRGRLGQIWADMIFEHVGSNLIEKVLFLVNVHEHRGATTLFSLIQEGSPVIPGSW